MINQRFCFEAFKTQAKKNITKYYRTQEIFANKIGYTRKQVNYLLNHIESMKLDTILLFANNLEIDLGKYYVQA